MYFIWCEAITQKCDYVCVCVWVCLGGQTACSYLLTHYDWALDPPDQNTSYKWLPASRPAEPLHLSFTRLDQTGSCPTHPQ